MKLFSAAVALFGIHGATAARSYHDWAEDGNWCFEHGGLDATYTAEVQKALVEVISGGPKEGLVAEITLEQKVGCGLVPRVFLQCENFSGAHNAFFPCFCGEDDEVCHA